MSGDWKKLGLIYKPDPNIKWSRSHGMLPTPLLLGGTRYRIYFGGRNAENQSTIAFFEVDINEPEKILRKSEHPVMSPGRLGCFDDNGVLPSCIVRGAEGLMMYYIGFKPGGTTRMDLFGGLALSRDEGLTFQRWSEAPIIERCRVNPFINTAPWVTQLDSGEWMMHYVSGVEWIHRDLPRYNIQQAISKDGLLWERHGDVAIDFCEGENALARPYVWQEKNGGWKMLFSAKGDFYQTVSASSTDGKNWVRDEPGEWFDPGLSGPDEEMVAYPILLEAEARHIVYYNGNGYGSEGICLAVRELKS